MIVKLLNGVTFWKGEHMSKKRNPQDATFRNIRALKKRVTILEITVGNYGKLIDLLLTKLDKKR